MYLSRLDIFGFKSFAQKTTLKFTEGVTAVVGPNGCGKSNVVDAIRWALGEQKSSTLRTDSMGDVIFNGSKNRKPLGMAEVTLVIENNKSILPMEYSEVALTRRLFRNGDSQYLINNSPCRLRDIIDLFMDTGLGSDSYSVIELKMIEQILSGKNEERRHLFEEAAGVVKYKQRRKEALKKMEAVDADFTRAVDIQREVQKTVAQLGRQADRARRYNELYNDLKKVELQFYSRDYQKNTTELATLQAEIERIEQIIRDGESKIEELQNHLNEVNFNLENADNKRKKAQEKENFILQEISNAKKELAVLEERRTAEKRAIERIEKEIEEAKLKGEKNEEQIFNEGEKLDKLEKEIAEHKENFEKLTNQRQESSADLAELRRELSDAAEESMTSLNKTNAAKTTKQRVETRRLVLESEIDRFQGEIDRLETRKSEIEESEKLESDKVQLATENIAGAERELAGANEKRAELQTKIETAQENVSARKSSLSHNTATRDFLKSLVDNGEINNFLNKSADWRPESEKITFAELIDTPDEYRVAMEAALGEYAKFFVVNNTGEADSAFNALIKNGKGKAEIIVRELIKESADAYYNEKLDSAVWASEIAEIPSDLKNALRIILGKTAIANDQATARQLIADGKADVAVTIAGEMFSNYGSIKNGGHTKTEGMTIGRKERLNRLNADIESAKSEIADLENEIREAKANLNAININKLSDNIRRAEAEKNNIEKKILELKSRKEGLESNKKVHFQNITRLNEEYAQIGKEIESANAEIDKYESEYQIARESQAAEQAAVRSKELEYNRIDEAFRKTESSIARVKAEIQGAGTNLKRSQEELAFLRVKKEDLQTELERLQSDSNKYSDESAELNKIIKNLDESLEIAIAQTKTAIAELETIKIESKTVAEGLEKERKNRDRVVSNNGDKLGKKAVLESRIANVVERLTEDLKITLEDLLNVELGEQTIETLKRQIDELKAKLSGLGNVNFMALEEFDAQNERLKFYNEQVADLEKAKNTLSETIAEINETAKGKFLVTFEQVKENFIRLFKILFGEDGSAELMLGEGDPLEAEIHVMAKPPGKMPRNIEMLSGGEKTLTAIALLFGIYLVKPSPFCILDEVDAPLDETNIDRFIQLIREFSKNTQFLVVTHSKRTMEFSDALYGVTQKEEGVSSIVSAKFAEETLNP